MRRTETSRFMVGTSTVIGAAFVLMCGVPAFAQTPTSGQDADALAKQLANPVASLVSVPFQFNWDHGLGPAGEGRRFLLNLQPVLPFKMNDDWNFIARIIVPTLAQPVLVEGGAPSSGMGDILFSAFFSPNKGGVIWGAGPAVALPVSSDPMLGSGKYSLGPTVVVLKQTGPWTYGALVNQVWSIGGDAGRSDVSQTFLQPFIAYGKKGWTVSLNSESSANWEAADDQTWTVPINMAVSRVVRLGTRPVSVGGGPRFYAKSPSGGPSWGFRFTMTLMFPAVSGK